MRNEEYEKLFHQALKGNGVLFKGFSNFHNYSWLNQLWAMTQMLEMGLPIGPIATYKRWGSLNRQVQKGSKALALLMPVTVDEKDANGIKTGKKKRLFVPKRNWFTLAQTEGDNVDAEFPEVGYDWDRAFAELNITRVDFAKVNGNIAGYATSKRTIAINPIITEDVDGTLFHEMAHIVLGHLDEKEGVDILTDLFGDGREAKLREVEAEGVALCCKLALGLGNTEYQVGYIRNWWKNNEIPAVNIKRIFKVTNEILKAGQEKPEKAGTNGAGDEKSSLPQTRVDNGTGTGIINSMKREQAEKLLALCGELDDNGNDIFVLYNASPYVAEIGSGEIYEEEDGRIIYSDSALSDVDVEKAKVEHFTVYKRYDDWMDGVEGVSFV